MPSRPTLPLFSLIPLLILASCSPVDPDQRPASHNAERIAETSPLSTFEDLTDRDDVLFNLELAYNERNLNEFYRLLDADFVFHFGTADVSQGNVPVSEWPRPDEVESAMAIFYKLEVPTGIRPSTGITEPTGLAVVEQATWGALKASFHGGILICAENINVSLAYPPGDFTWTSFPAPPPFTGETWYEKTVTYELMIDADGTIYVSGSRNAFFVIRLVDFYGVSIYRLVDWRDDL
ncbi:MAG: hypothetical protein O7D32_02645 [bacterium]|nr:hypothetical protein [bacterium]